MTYDQAIRKCNDLEEQSGQEWEPFYSHETGYFEIRKCSGQVGVNEVKSLEDLMNEPI